MRNLGYDKSDISADTSSPSGIGNVCAQALLNYRHTDGSNQLGDLHPGAYSDYTGYVPVNKVDMLNDPNRWQPLLVNGVPQTWLLPQWGLVKPFALISGSQFRDLILIYGPAQSAPEPLRLLDTGTLSPKKSRGATGTPLTMM